MPLFAFARSIAPRAVALRLAALLLPLCLLVACAHKPVPTQVAYDRTWPAWNKVVAHYAHPDGVDYAALAAQRAELDAALAAFQAVRPETFAAWPEADRLAYLINVHNAFAIKRVIDVWPVDSIAGTRFLGSPLKARDIGIIGRTWSLAELQREIMGSEYVESRALFLINWGERGCAPLAPVAITSVNLPDLLERQARRFLSDPEYCTYDQREFVISLSPLLEQYEPELMRDFTNWWIFLQRYLPADQARIAKIHPPRVRFLDFDRRLNNIQPRVAATPAQ